MRHTFFCIDGHTAGNPVRLVAGGAPALLGATMSERRADFLARFDWIRTGLCFEPRGHDMMSGGFIYPPIGPDSDAAILFIETSGCLPMCGHGTIGMVTFALEHGLITPREPGRLRLDVPAGTVDVSYREDNGRVVAVAIRNVPSFVAATGVAVDLPGLGRLTVDVAYGGNFYAIVEPQNRYEGIDALGPARILALSPVLRSLVRERIEPVHPLDGTIRGVSHVLWADPPGAVDPGIGRNAVFYGAKAIDRSPCGTGTSARLAHLWSRGTLRVGDRFRHESIIHSHFDARIDAETRVGAHPAIVPVVEGSAVATGHNTIWLDRADPFWRGFQLV